MKKGKKIQPRNPLVQNGKWKCPCCQNFTLEEGPSYWEVCPVCGWEDDGQWDPRERSACNHMTLEEGRCKYAVDGVVADHMVKWVRKPTESEKPKGE